MFNLFKRNPKFVIVQNDATNRFHIINTSTMTSVADYARKRDAVRGATRKGITLAD